MDLKKTLQAIHKKAEERTLPQLKQIEEDSKFVYETIRELSKKAEPILTVLNACRENNIDIPDQLRHSLRDTDNNKIYPLFDVDTKSYIGLGSELRDGASNMIIGLSEIHFGDSKYLESLSHIRISQLSPEYFSKVFSRLNENNYKDFVKAIDSYKTGFDEYEEKLTEFADKLIEDTKENDYLER